jgi:hypothetical protein
MRLKAQDKATRKLQDSTRPSARDGDKVAAEGLSSVGAGSAAAAAAAAAAKCASGAVDTSAPGTDRPTSEQPALQHCSLSHHMCQEQEQQALSRLQPDLAAKYRSLPAGVKQTHSQLHTKRASQ